MRVCREGAGRGPGQRAITAHGDGGWVGGGAGRGPGPRDGAQV